MVNINFLCFAFLFKNQVHRTNLRPDVYQSNFKLSRIRLKFISRRPECNGVVIGVGGMELSCFVLFVIVCHLQGVIHGVTKYGIDTDDE